jgi:alcohol dehydrogenase
LLQNKLRPFVLKNVCIFFSFTQTNHQSRSMRAVVFDGYAKDWQSRLKVVSHPKPKLEKGDIIVRVRYASVNPADWKQITGSMKLVVWATLPRVTGMDYSGDVVEVGSDVKKFKIGDAVYGRLAFPKCDGPHAEYVKVSHDYITKKPSSLSYEEAASLGVAAQTAWDVLVGTLHLDPQDSKKNSNKKILIIGCAGGVGLTMVQIARALEVKEVWGICSGENQSFMERFGVKVIDYKKGLKTQLRDKPKYFDGIVDCVGGQSYFDLGQPILHPSGLFVSIVGKSESECKMFAEGLLGDVSIGVNILTRMISSGNRYSLYKGLTTSTSWNRCTQFVADSKMSIFVNQEQIYSLENAKRAFQASQAGRARGKILLRVYDPKDSEPDTSLSLSASV